jgi:hypothetical protein
MGALPTMGIPAQQYSIPDGLNTDNMVAFSRTPAGQAILQQILARLTGRM